MSSNPGELPHRRHEEKPQLKLLRHHFAAGHLASGPLTGTTDWTHDLVEHSRDLLCVHDLDGRLLSINPVPARLLGYSVEEVVGAHMRDFLDPGFRDRFDDYLRQLARTGEASGTLAILTRAGKRRLWEYRCTLHTDGLEQPVILGIAHDVTDRMAAEKALRESNQKLAETAAAREELLRGLQLFRTLLDHSNDAIEVVEPGTLRLLDVNETSCAELGYTRQELLSMTIFDIDPQLTPDFVARTNKQLLENGSVTVQSLHRRKDGTTFPVEVNTRRVQLDREYFVAISRDITERRLREGRLQEYEKVVESLDEMIVVVNRDHRYVLANRAFLSYRGLTEPQVVGRHVTEILDPDTYEKTVRPRLEEAFRGQVVTYEMSYAYPQIGERNLEVTYLPVEGPHGIDRVAGVLRDVTDRKRAAARLEESEQRFRAVHDRAPVGIVIADPRSGKFLQVNPKFCEIVGRTQEEILRLRFQDITHPDDRHESLRLATQVFDGKIRDFDLQKRYLRPDGSTVWASLSVVGMWEPGEPARSNMAIVQDITERKRTEEALRESEERVRLAHEVAQIGIFERNMQVGGSRWTPEMEGMYGIPQGSAPSSVEDFLRLVHPADRQNLQRRIDESIVTGRSGGEWRVVWPDGSIHWIAGTWRMFTDELGRPLRALGVDIDITRRKEMEEALRDSEAGLQEAQRVALMGNWYLDLLTQTVTGSDQMFRIMGMEPRPLGIPFHELRSFFLPESWRHIVETQHKAFETGRPDEIEVAGLRPDGSVTWLLVRGNANTDDAGRVFGLSGIAIDITERKRAEQALRESEERLRLAQEVARIGIFDQDLITGETRGTPQLQAMYGLRGPNEFPRSVDDFLNLVHPDDRPHVSSLVAQSFASGEGGGEWRTRWRDGTVHWISSKWRVFKDAGGRPIRVIGSDYDITDRKLIEQELRAAQEKLTEEKLYLEQEIDAELGFEEIIGQSKALKAVMESVGKVAASDATVLILGETGTGKELVARAIHRMSQRNGNAFIKMNCSAIPSGLLESELFGHEKGAFTGAVNRKVGRLELADRGTIFLDEIGEISLALQPKLLRVLQDQEFERLGGTQTLKVNFRLIAATNSDLATSVREKQFRSDLYYRLHVFPILLPPLRQRREDIPLLVEHFVQKIARRMKKSIKGIPRKTMDALINWSWPGNVRELENFLERSVILTSGSVLTAPLSELQPPASDAPEDETLEAAERRHILKALRDARGRISGPRGAATRLGLKRTTLQSKLKQLGINPRTLT